MTPGSINLTGSNSNHLVYPSRVEVFHDLSGPQFNLACFRWGWIVGQWQCDCRTTQSYGRLLGSCFGDWNLPGQKAQPQDKIWGLIVTLISLFDLTQQELVKLILGC